MGQVLGAVAELLLPAGCASCAGWIPSGERRRLVCDRCRTRLRAAAWPRCTRCDHPLGTGRERAPDCIECRSWPDALTAARQAVLLQGPAVRLVHGLKYEGWSALARPMGERMAAVRLPSPAEHSPGGAPPSGAGRRVLVPIPTTADRMRRRGYNQAALLADHVGRSLGSVVRDALERTRGGASQTKLRPDERIENVRGAFRCVRPLWIEGAEVLLIDDVLTTGATAGEAARVLSDAGAGCVTLLTYARALPDAV